MRTASMSLGRFTRGCMCLIAGSCLMVQAWAEEPAGPAASTESPTVTRREAALLATVTSLGATNAPAALILLLPALDAEASGALDFTAGNLSLQAGDHAGALEHYQAALSKAPGFRTARLNGARAALLADNHQAALDVLLPLLAGSGAGADGLLLLGHAHALMSRPVSAESAYRQALLLDAENLDAMMGLTKALLLQARYAEGSAMAQECLVRDLERAEAWSLSADAARAAGEDQAAVIRLETARRLNLATPAMLATLGDYHAMQERPKEAIAIYRLAFAHAAPSHARMLRAAQALLSLDRTAEGEVYLARLSAQANQLSRHDQVLLHRLKSLVHEQGGDRAAAMKELQTALKLDPLNAELLVRLGDLQRSAGELLKAETNYRRAGEDQAWRGRALLRRAVIAAEGGHYRDAVTLLEEAQRADAALAIGRYLTAMRSLAASGR
jgi:tetratricopeptide (TPR) repeat protein